MNANTRDVTLSRLHPAIRDTVGLIQETLGAEGIPLQVFEAFRSPQRQAALYAQGRTRPGNKVTWARPWESYHQYGLAVDFVIRTSKGWSWDTSGAAARYWPRLHELAKAHGMTPLYNRKGQLVEAPHVQLAGLSARQLYAGAYPQGGDDDWAEALADMIETWSGSPPAPPVPRLSRRPGLLAADLVNPDPIPAPAEASGLAADATFQRLHAFIREAEGGFSDHPRDKGGPTNMGITQATLAAWRKTAVTAEDIRALTRDEADLILRSNYYIPCRCGEMPERTAMVVYNGAVLHGPTQSIRLLQQAFNTLGLRVDGKLLEVDGDIGRLTMTAARKTDPRVLSEAYLDAQIAFLRKHEDFDVFGAGWMNRLAALRAFLNELPSAGGIRPDKEITVKDSPATAGPDALSDALADALETPARPGNDRLGALLKLALAQALAERTGDSAEARALKDVLRAGIGRYLPADMPGRKPLTPVNAALGGPLGRMLDGKKSVIGVVGLLATVLLPNIGVSGALVSYVANHQTELLTMLATFTGWGFLGKIDKMVRHAG